MPIVAININNDDEVVKKSALAVAYFPRKSALARVSSALIRFTTLFGMSKGGSGSLKLPRQTNYTQRFYKYQEFRKAFWYTKVYV